MPPASIIAAVKEKYDVLTAFSGKPATLWFGSAWPSNAVFPFIRFRNPNSEIDTTFAHQVGERWSFAFEIFAETPQAAELVFNRVMYNNQPPSAGAGFWKPVSFAVPTGYVFKHLIMDGGFRVETADDRFGPSGASLTKLSWRMELWVQRAEV